MMTTQYLSPAQVLACIHRMEIETVRQARVTPHFKWGEFFIHRSPVELQELTLEHLQALERLAQRLEGVRRQLGNRPMRITSGWRDILSNRRVGGAYASRHLVGQAADVVVQGLSPRQVQARLEASWPGGMGYGKTFTHLDIRPYRARFSY